MRRRSGSSPRGKRIQAFRNAFFETPAVQGVAGGFDDEHEHDDEHGRKASPSLTLGLLH
jgi:hypothetical protein